VTWVMWNLVSVYLEIVLVSVQDRCIVCAKCTTGSEKSFWPHMMEQLGDVVMWNLISVHLEIVLLLTQDRCTVCAQCTAGLQIISDAPDGTPRRLGLCEISFRSV
jgi:ferredoxin